MRAMVCVNGYDFPEPSEYNATTSTFVDSARNVEGYVVGAVVRENVAKAAMSWRFISADDWSNILSQFDTARGGSFYNDVTLFIQDTNAWETRRMYVSDRTAAVYTRNSDGSIRGYTDASLSLVEV